MKNAVVMLTLLTFCLALNGCATVSAEGKSGLSRSETKRLEKENEYNFIKGILTFSGLVVGGLVGVFTVSDSDKLVSMLKGCAIGTAAGFGAGYVITENMKNAEPDLHTSKADEYFKEYKMIKGKD